MEISEKDILNNDAARACLCDCVAVANITQEGNFVFDGFMGSGTTAVACQHLKRHFFGCELNKDYYEKSLKRLDDEKRQLNLF